MAILIAMFCSGWVARAAPATTIAHGRLHADGLAVDRLAELPEPPSVFGHALTGVARLLATATEVNNALPAVWCGTERATDDVEHERDNGPYRFHAIYALPADATDRFASVASTLQADVFQASALLERLYSRALRLDLGTSCGPQYLDISVVRLQDRTDSLAFRATDANGLIDRVAGDLRAQGFGVHGTTVASDELPTFAKNYVVWLEDVVPPEGLCGMANQFTDQRRASDNLNNFGGQLALVLRSGAAFCDSNTVRHELGHSLGALQPGAPHAFDGAHCDDAYEDTMCYQLAPRVASDSYQSEFFDYRNDDYWDPPGGALSRWTVNLSNFVCPDVACNAATSGASDPFAMLNQAIAGLFVSCPQGAIVSGKTCPANTTTKTGSEVVVASAVPKVTLTARRVRRGRWRIHVRLSGPGTAQVAVRCRRGRHRVRVLSRRVTAPTSVRATVRCDRRPSATAAAR